MRCTNCLTGETRDFLCAACYEQIAQEHRSEHARQDVACAIMDRDNSYVAMRRIGESTYIALGNLIFGAMIVLGEYDDCWGYEACWDYTKPNTPAARLRARLAFEEFNGVGDPAGWNRKRQNGKFIYPKD